MMHARTNQVRIPRLLHEKINGYMNRRNEITDHLPPNVWLKGKSFEEQRQFGLSVLREYGVIE